MRIETTIIWDEAPMINMYCVKTLDLLLYDITNCTIPFGGKVMIMGGYFRQVLPVIAKGNKAQMISSCIIRFYLWQIQRSTSALNMRLCMITTSYNFLCGLKMTMNLPNQTILLGYPTKLEYHGRKKVLYIILYNIHFFN